ncbi:hypothetical protein UlMin_026548 [Ulmus minor]
MAPFQCYKLPFCILAIFILIFSSTSKASVARETKSHMKSNYTQFIKMGCGITLYPIVCFQTLSSYSEIIKTSPFELAYVALNVSLRSSQSTSNLVTKLSKELNFSRREANALKDCVENMSDSIDQLRQSLAAMEDLEGPDFELEISNIETWVSSALTDEDTCMDGFEETGAINNGKIRGTIGSNIVRVAQLTSNALALVKRLSSS